MSITLTGLAALTLTSTPSANASVVIFAPQPQRYAEWDGLSGGFDDASLQGAATNLSYIVVNKADRDGNISAQYEDVNNLALAGAQAGNNLRVFAYIMSTRWMTSSGRQMLPYTNTFPIDSSWYLKDSQGNAIPFYAESDLHHTQPAVGFVLDTANALYRAWLNLTIADWLTQAAFAGIALDATNLISGLNAPMAQVGDGTTTWNEMLCGPGQYTSDCSRVKAVNAGLQTLLQATTDTAHSLGMEVVYNGIGPSQNRGTERNLSLLNNADIAANESFCYGADGSGSFHLNSLQRDWDIMSTQAAAGKKIFEIVNYYTASNNTTWGDYCVAGFMLGWVPGYDYMVYHQDYSEAIPTTPATPELNMNLGNPIGPRVLDGRVYSRRFQNGFVALNPTLNSQVFRTPVAMTQYANGHAIVSYPANSLITLRTNAAMLFLYNSYLY